MGSTLFPLWCDVFARAVFYSPIAIAWGCTLFRRLGAVRSTAVFGWCLALSVLFGRYLGHVSQVSCSYLGGVLVMFWWCVCVPCFF